MLRWFRNVAGHCILHTIMSVALKEHLQRMKAGMHGWFSSTWGRKMMTISFYSLMLWDRPQGGIVSRLAEVHLIAGSLGIRQPWSCWRCKQSACNGRANIADLANGQNGIRTLSRYAFVYSVWGPGRGKLAKTSQQMPLEESRIIAVLRMLRLPYKAMW